MKGTKKKCRYVQELEEFFGSEFSVKQLTDAVEEMNVFANKNTKIGNAVSTEPKSVALCVLAAYKIRELYDGTYYHPDGGSENYYSKENMRNQSYKIGMDIVDGKYETMDQAICAYEKII